MGLEHGWLYSMEPFNVIHMETWPTPAAGLPANISIVTRTERQ
eukprot:gene6653-9397_t